VHLPSTAVTLPYAVGLADGGWQKARGEPEPDRGLNARNSFVEGLPNTILRYPASRRYSAFRHR
jgi:hypothetical protein